MSKLWEADDNFVMYLNSGNQGTHPLELGLKTGIGNSLVLVTRLASGLAQYVLHALIQ